MRRVVAGVCTVLLLPFGAMSTGMAKEPEVKSPKMTKQFVNQDLKLWYTSPANINSAENSGGEWMQQSLPLGNGNLGNLIFGGITKERIHFNEKTLWTGGPAQSRPDYQFGNKKTAYTQQEINDYRKVLDDKSKNVFNDDPQLGGIGMSRPIKFSGASNLVKGSYQDFGDIWLDFSSMGIKDKEVKNYKRELNLQTGIAQTEFIHKGVYYKREHFVSSPDNAMVTEVSASEKGKLSFDVKMELNNNGLEGKTLLDSKTQTYTILGRVKDNNLKFYTTMKIVLEGGNLVLDAEKQIYKIKNADRVKLVMATETDYKNDYPVYRDNKKDLKKIVDHRVDGCAKKSYKELKKNHIKDHQSLFDRVSLDLGECRSTIPTNELMDEYRAGNYSKYLEVLAFQYGRYLTIAGSRGTLPSNLVGLWTIGDSAWTGDYHFNVNVQMNYWPVYATNLAECGTTFVEYMENLREPGRLTAERVHGIKDAVKNHTGFTVHTENNPFGMTAPSNAQEYGWNPTGAAWAIQNLWWHYEFTQDEEYLRKTIYPIMKEAALFWDNYLWTSDYQVIHDENSPFNGEKRLVVAPSFSEEQGPTAVGTTYDQSLVWELYNECIKAGKIVGEDQKLLNSWEEKMQKLDPIEINATNGIKEWYEETRVGTDSGHNKSYAKAGQLAEIAVPNSGWYIGHPGEHRHSSHLVGLFPGTLINRENKPYMDAAVQSLIERGEYSTGWSKANKINLWARTENGEKAYRLLNNLIGGKTSGLQYNLFDSHGTGGGDTMMGAGGNTVWQIDGNYGLTSGVAEMLVQSQLGYTQFLPAIPAAWDNGDVQGLKARGNFTIGESWENGLAEEFTVCYEGDKERSIFTGSYENITSARVYQDGKELQVTKNKQKNQISFEVLKGKTYTIDLSEANSVELKKQANEFLKKIHPDLQQVKSELTKAIENSSKDLRSILTKAKKMNQLYSTYLEESENVYCLTNKEGLTYSQIDEIYNQLRELRKVLLENTGDFPYYQQASSQLDTIVNTLNQQMENRVISFSKESGLLKAGDLTLSLSKSEKAPDYEIRYTVDGSIPRNTSESYKTPLQLKEGENTIVRAALFYKEQRVSPVYTKKYVSNGVSVKGVEVSHKDNWVDAYVKEKMIDADHTTRWAAKGVTNSNAMDIILKFGKKETLNQIKFDLFVSNKNAINGFEIYGLVGQTYKKIYEDTKMGNIDDKVGNVDGGSGGYHAYYFAEFPEIETDSVKVILKSGYLGEPSIYEITPLNVAVKKDEKGDESELKKMLKKAKEADRNTEYYQNAEKNLKDAFEESILDGEKMLDAPQDILDSRAQFIRNRYNRLGFGETDKSVLNELIKQAESAVNGEYLNDGVYRLKKVLGKAKEVQKDEGVKQSAVDQMVKVLQDALNNLKARYEEINIPSTELQGGTGWIKVGTFRATNDDNAGTLTGKFSGNYVQVNTVKGDDHGIIKITIVDKNQKTVYSEEIDTYNAERKDNVELMNRKLDEGEYTIRFERVGKNQSSKNGWVEVGNVKVRRSKEEVVDRSKLEVELQMCQELHEEQYTKESWKALQDVIYSAQDLLKKNNVDTCTTEMNDKALELGAARLNLQKVVDISELQENLNKAKGILPEGYTKESYNALSKCICEIESFLQGTYTQGEVNQKVVLLKQRMNELRAEKTKLQQKYDEIKNLEQGSITEESWKIFLNLREEAQKILDNPNAMPNEVSGILNKLNEFRFSYKKLEPVKPNPVKPEQSNAGSSDVLQNGTKTPNKNVKTGDSSLIGFYVILMLFTAGTGIIFKKKYKDGKNL